MTSQLRMLIFGAHPDDCEFTAGGTAARYTALGHRVLLVSVTNGDAGHHEQAGAILARRRRTEAAAAAAVIGAESLLLDNHDGELLPTLEARRAIIGVIREYRPDLIISPRPNDYHPDHRYTAQLVQDAAYMITVPNIVTAYRHLELNPVIMYCSDTFQKPVPFAADVVVPIDTVAEHKVDMLHAHTSQIYEWLPYNGGYLAQVPAEDIARRTWLRQRLDDRLRRDADRFRIELCRAYGTAVGGAVQYAEAFEVCEYGAVLDATARRRLFPFGEITNSML